LQEARGRQAGDSAADDHDIKGGLSRRRAELRKLCAGPCVVAHVVFPWSRLRDSATYLAVLRPARFEACINLVACFGPRAASKRNFLPRVSLYETKNRSSSFNRLSLISLSD